MEYAARRKAMVDSQIRPNDVTRRDLLDAFETVPRELFLPSDLRPLAYVEKELEVAPGRFALTPRDLAKLLQTLKITKSDLVLDVGCAGGYTTALLAAVGGMVVAVEDDVGLAKAADQNLAARETANAAVIVGPLAAGAASQGPFDVIVIAGVVEDVPASLLDQLKDHGRLGAVLFANGVAEGVVIRRAGDVFGRTTVFTASAHVALPGFVKPKAFAF